MRNFYTSWTLFFTSSSSTLAIADAVDSLSLISSTLEMLKVGEYLLHFFFDLASKKGWRMSSSPLRL